MEHTPEDLKLIYVLKIGYNSKGQGLYEFVFSKDPDNIDIEGWNWDTSPACDNAIPPTDDHVDEIFSLKTDSFDLFCLHEAVDRPYIHGYYNIHCLAYEDLESENIDTKNIADYENIFDKNLKSSTNNDDVPLLVFHYRMTLKDVEDLLYERDIILKGNEFLQSKNIKIKT